MKTRLRLVLLQLILVSFAGAVVFGQSPASFSGPRAYLGDSAVIADFTGDGILDMATIDQTTSEIHIHAGLGNGKFAGDEVFEINTAGAGAENFFMATADLNGDGLADLVVGIRSSTNQSLIQPLLRNAGGGFRATAIFAPKTAFDNVYLADVNSDGRPDLVVVGTTAGVLIANGDGTFQPEIEAFSQDIPTPCLAIGDFNNDGNPDLAINVANGIFILFGDGTGRFPTGTTFTTTEEFGPIAAADLNGDGKQDLIVESSQKGLVEVLLGDGQGGFGIPQVYFVGPGGNDAIGVAIGDVNGDGILDIVTPDPAVLIGKGDGTFEDPVGFPGNEEWRNLQLADLRGIGQLDVIADVLFPNSVHTISNSTVLLNTGTGTFRDGENIPTSLPTFSVAVADFNRDGHDDLAVGLATSVEILLGTGQANPALTPALFLSFPNAQGAYPFSGDFNNDGIPDLLVREGSGTIAYLAGLGNGSFAPAVLTPVFLKPLAIGDFNGDGKLDLAGASGSVIEVLLGNGAGGFRPWTSFPKPTGLSSLLAADLNGDGLADLVAINSIASGGTNQFSVYLSQGGGSFQAHVYPLPGEPFIAYSAALADLNKDGILDVVIVGTPSSYVFLGQGAGAFVQQSQLMSLGTAGIAVDMNGDGLPDLALTDGLSVRVFLGNGTGSFSSPGNPDGLWFAPPGPNIVVPAYLQSQPASSGLADLITIGESTSGSYVGVLLNQAVTH